MLAQGGGPGAVDVQHKREARHGHVEQDGVARFPGPGEQREPEGISKAGPVWDRGGEGVRLRHVAFLVDEKPREPPSRYVFQES